MGCERCPSHAVPLYSEASVFCVSLDPKTNTLAVTGGEDDKAFVWRVSDGELLFECSGELLEAEGAAVFPPSHTSPDMLFTS